MPGIGGLIACEPVAKTSFENASICPSSSATVRALTSMGRASAFILIGLPFVLAALMTLVSPSYMKPFFTTSTGHSLIVFCLVSMTIGAFLLKRIVTVRY